MSTVQSADEDQRTPWQKARHLLWKILMLELWGYLSIARFVLRRPRVPAGAQPFTYHGPVLSTLLAFVVISAVELLVVDLVVRRWPTVRIVLLVLGVWGLVWMFGMLFGFLTRPHAVGPAGIRLRSGAELDLPLSWEQVEAVGRHKRVSQDTQPQVTVDEHGSRTVHLHVQHETNTAITLRGPVELRLPRGAVTASRIELFADDPDAFVAAAREHLRERAR